MCVTATAWRSDDSPLAGETRSALDELVFEANRQEQEARRIKLADAEEVARAADRSLAEDRAQARRCLERLKPHTRVDEVGRALAAVDATTLLGSWTQWVRAGADDAHGPTKCARKWRRFASPPVDWDVAQPEAGDWAALEGSAGGPGLTLHGEPVAALDLTPVKDADGTPSASPLAARLKRWFTNENGIAAVACADAALPALPAIRPGDWLKLRSDRGRWVRVSHIDRARKLLAIDAASALPQPVARAIGSAATAGVGNSTVEPYELWGAVVVRGLWPPFTAYTLPEGVDRAAGLARLVRWAAAEEGTAGRRQVWTRRPATLLFEAPFLELARAEEDALLLRWTPRWARRDAEAKARPPPRDDRAVAGKVALDRLLGDEVRALLLKPHRLDELYGRTWADLRVDGARCAGARDAQGWERLGIVARPHATLLTNVAEKCRIQGVPEPLVAKLGMAQRAAAEQLEVAEAEADYTIRLDVFRADRWQPVYAGPGAGCRVENLTPLTRYRVRCCVCATRGPVSKFATHAFCTSGPAPKRPRVIKWYKTPPDPSKVAGGPGWCERTCELALAPARTSRDAVYVVQIRDAAADEASWRRCYRGGSDRALVAGLAAGRTYLFRCAFSVGESIVRFGGVTEVTVPGVLPAGGAVAPAAAGKDTSATEDEDDVPQPPTALDDEWRVAWSEERRRPFYHNVATGRSQWTPPLSVG